MPRYAVLNFEDAKKWRGHADVSFALDGGCQLILCWSTFTCCVAGIHACTDLGTKHLGRIQGIESQLQRQMCPPAIINKRDLLQCFDGELPDLAKIDLYTGLFLTGSHCSANGPEPWIKAATDWVSDFACTHTTCKLLAICFGCQARWFDSSLQTPAWLCPRFLHPVVMQLLAKALGGKVGSNPSGQFVLTGRAVLYS